MSVEFQYRYRGHGNFKNYNSVVFGNENSLAVEEIDQRISQFLGSDRIFEASRLKIPEMFFKEFPYDPELDWQMHEYLGVSESDKPVSDPQHRDIQEFLSQMKAIST